MNEVRESSGCLGDQVDRLATISRRDVHLGANGIQEIVSVRLQRGEL